ncbi:MAG: hypothetical protein ACK4F4_04300 [Hylemonella sp.]|uniref:hypothetical protein n=1 Tax=Hylemonella sp. TaxID=2066020 RepID=UPI003919EA73
MNRCALLLLGLLSLSAGAQSLRDPTQPPGAGSVNAAAGARTDAPSWSVIVVDGRRHVAVGTRLYAEGQMLGRARVERITETEIWLREGQALRKVPLYAGVQRRSVPAAP